MSDDREARLPQWAQTELRQLRESVASLQARLAPPDLTTARIIVDPHADLRRASGGPSVIYPDNDVRYLCNARGTDYIDVSILPLGSSGGQWRQLGEGEPAEIKISASGQLVVIPHASNSVVMRVLS